MKPIQEILDQHQKVVNGGGIDPEVYSSECPLWSGPCATMECRSCRYYLTPKPCCRHCGSEQVGVVGYWRPNYEVPTTDGMHKCFQPMEQVYSRNVCADCKLITDLPHEGDAEVPPAVVQYASEVRAMHSHTQDSIITLEARVMDLYRLVTAMTYADQAMMERDPDADVD